MMPYQCSHCNVWHDDLPDIGADMPDQYWDVPEEQRAQRIVLTADTCIIDDEYFFIRGVIEIPVHEYSERFGFGVWVSLKQENFQTYVDHFNSDNIGPFFGWLCTRLGYYEEKTPLLKTMAYFRGAGVRPRIDVEPTDHALAVDQQNGVSLEKAWNIVHHYMNVDSE